MKPHLLRPKVNRNRAVVEKGVRLVLDTHGNDIAGYAFVIWGKDSSNTAICNDSPRSKIPHTLIPDFVRAAIHREVCHKWIEESK